MKAMRAIAAATLLTVATASAGCGYIMYPERKGNHGNIDTTTLVFDLLWLIPGIIPGVVFLVVDFAIGTMYVNGRVALRASPTGDVGVKLEDASQPITLELRLVTASQRVLDAQTLAVGPHVHGQSTLLHVGSSIPALHERVYLQILDAAHGDRLLQAPIEVL